MAATIEVKYFNSFVLRKTLNSSGAAAWNGSKGDGTYPAISPNNANAKNWAIEESRIRGGYNNTSTGYGVKAYLGEDNPQGSVRINSMIYSGIFHSRTAVNDTTVFYVGDERLKIVDSANG